MTNLDKNGDQSLDAAELEAAPGLKAALKQIDSNSDGRLDVTEIATRIAEYERAGVGLRNETYRFNMNGRPLADAEVIFTPEAFFEGTIQAGKGLTGQNGSTSMRIDGNPLPGLTCGMYRVTVSKMGSAGKEMLPAKYNSATTLGYEFPPKEVSSDQYRTFNLTTK